MDESSTTKRKTARVMPAFFLESSKKKVKNDHLSESLRDSVCGELKKNGKPCTRKGKCPYHKTDAKKSRYVPLDLIFTKKSPRKKEENGFLAKKGTVKKVVVEESFDEIESFEEEEPHKKDYLEEGEEVEFSVEDSKEFPKKQEETLSETTLQNTVSKSKKDFLFDLQEFASQDSQNCTQVTKNLPIRKNPLMERLATELYHPLNEIFSIPPNQMAANDFTQSFNNPNPNLSFCEELEDVSEEQRTPQRQFLQNVSCLVRLDEKKEEKEEDCDTQLSEEEGDLLQSELCASVSKMSVSKKRETREEKEEEDSREKNLAQLSAIRQAKGGVHTPTPSHTPDNVEESYKMLSFSGSNPLKKSLKFENEETQNESNELVELVGSPLLLNLSDKSNEIPHKNFQTPPTACNTSHFAQGNEEEASLLLFKTPISKIRIPLSTVKLERTPLASPIQRQLTTPSTPKLATPNLKDLISKHLERDTKKLATSPITSAVNRIFYAPSPLKPKQGKREEKENVANEQKQLKEGMKHQSRLQLPFFLQESHQGAQQMPFVYNININLPLFDSNQAWK